MRGSADTARLLDVNSCRAFFRFEIVPDDRPLKLKLESTSDLSHSEMRGARGPLFRSRFGHVFSLPFLGSSFVATFRDSNFDSRNGVCFATSRHTRKIIAPEALPSRAIFLSARPNSFPEGERCMKDTVHPAVHFSVHPRIFERVRNRRSCARRDDLIGRGQNTGLGWSDPTFAHVSVPK